MSFGGKVNCAVPAKNSYRVPQSRRRLADVLSIIRWYTQPINSYAKDSLRERVCRFDDGMERNDVLQLLQYALQQNVVHRLSSSGVPAGFPGSPGHHGAENEVVDEKEETQTIIMGKACFWKKFRFAKLFLSSETHCHLAIAVSRRTCSKGNRRAHSRAARPQCHTSTPSKATTLSLALRRSLRAAVACVSVLARRVGDSAGTAVHKSSLLSATCQAPCHLGWH